MEGVATDRQIPGHEEYRAAFQLFDRNNDGRISFEELEQVIRSLGRNPQQQEIRDMITEFDADGNGTIEYEEFYNFMTREMEESEAEEALRAAFNAMDSDGDGFITESELRQVMINLHAGLGDGEVEQMIRNADSNGDRKISYLEFQGINKQHFS
ncbi:calmodulin-like protein 11 isoform X2 [Cinnamomum micranthum f. kanehirae]|uniref:Calmodulin-like protein 11 isoform X2 n=1 Tax=Cinnamomum micranthum f. kanehirae TaxID=337451 RepID=A0A3S3Q7W5_9MAGN|nr:calmodulin-like protein 11 isoform X2 [Cinnamomum micranthum f. kanehirae]